MRVDAGRRHPHPRPLDTDPRALERPREAEHVPHRRVAAGVLQERLSDPLGPQRVSGHKDKFGDVAGSAPMCVLMPMILPNGDPPRGRGRAPVAFSAVACPSGLRSTPRKRVKVQAFPGFESPRHRPRPAQTLGSSLTDEAGRSRFRLTSHAHARCLVRQRSCEASERRRPTSVAVRRFCTTKCTAVRLHCGDVCQAGALYDKNAALYDVLWNTGLCRCRTEGDSS